MKRRVCALLLCAALLVGMASVFSSCGKNDTLNSFTWFVDTLPANLDPQTATESADVIACTHLYARLFRKTADGGLEKDACTEYTVSPDGLTYTFTLKPNLSYQARNGAATVYTVTAQDFVFAFQRIFDKATASPYAASFASIRGSSACLSGSSSALGVSAPDETTFVITLSSPDDSLLEKLALPGAAPCNQAFFESTKGAYGLDSKDTLSSGAFYLYNWTEGGLFLRREASGNKINNLRLVQNMDASGMTPVSLLENGKCNAILDTGAEETVLQALPYSDTTWCLAFNCNSTFSSAALRKALAADACAMSLPENETLYSAANGIVPSGAAVDGNDYRTVSGALSADTTDAMAAYQQGLQETGAENLKGLKILVPEGIDDTWLQALNSRWQQDYSLFFSIETLPIDQFTKRYEAGDYALAIVPLTLSQSDPLSMLTAFSDDAAYSSDAYQAAIAQASGSIGVTKCHALATAESLLVSDYAVIPLYAQNKRLLVDSAISGLRFEPYGPVIDVTEAALAS